jgi:uncharacterized protein
MAIAIPNVYQREPGFVFSHAPTPPNFPESGLEGVCAMMGRTLWGPTELTLVSSLGEFTEKFGGFISETYPTHRYIKKLFDNSLFDGQAAPVLFKRVLAYTDITDASTVTATKSAGFIYDGEPTPSVIGNAVAVVSTGDEVAVSGGTYTGTVNGVYKVEVTTGAATYATSVVTISFTPDGGGETEIGTAIPISGDPITLENGVTLTLTDGGDGALTQDDTWTITVTAEGQTAGDQRINVYARYFGVYGNTISVQTQAPTGGEDGDFNLVVKVDGVAKETFEDLSVDITSLRYFETVVNLQSQIIFVEDTNNIEDVGIGQENTLIGGTDGDVPVRADYIGSADSDTGLYGFLSTRYPVRFSCPDMEVHAESTTFMRNVDTFIKGFMNRMWRPNVVPKTLQRYDLIETWFNGDVQLDSEFQAMYYGWLPDEDTGILMSPASAICGLSSKTARNRAQYGVWTNFAGGNFPLVGFNGVHKEFNSDVNGKLNELGINVIKNETGVGIYPNGCRTMSKTKKRDYKYIAQVLNTYDCESMLEKGLDFVKFKNLSNTLYNEMNITATSILAARNAEGGFNTEDGAPFAVICDNSIQTPEMKNKGIVLLKWGIRNRFCAEFIWLHFTPMTSGASL